MYDTPTPAQAKYIKYISEIDEKLTNDTVDFKIGKGKNNLV